MHSHVQTAAYGLPQATRQRCCEVTSTGQVARRSRCGARTRASGRLELEMSIDYFCGVKPNTSGTVGHFCYQPGYWRAGLDEMVKSPWALHSSPFSEICVEEVCNRCEPQLEGIPKFLYKDGWTLMVLWDRSGDHRGNSSASFCHLGKLDSTEMLANTKRLWPRLFKRIEDHLGYTVVV